MIALAVCVTGVALAGPPRVDVVKQRRHHCGVASAETILRSYGDRDAWTRQTAIAAALCARLPEYKARHPEAADAIERYYPDYQETYQPLLAEFLIDHGYCVVNTRASVDRGTGKPDPQVGGLLREHLAKGHRAVLHVPGHYMSAIGVGEAGKTLYFVDPLHPKSVFSTPFETLAGGGSFHRFPSGKPRPGWDGRALIFWKGAAINKKDRCPVCGHVSAGSQRTYCRRCLCFIDRRTSNGVQLALDAVASTIVKRDITRIQDDELRPRLRRLLKAGSFTENQLTEALLHYPLAGPDPHRLVTLHRHGKDRAIDYANLSLNDLIGVISAHKRWPKVLDERLAARRGERSDDREGDS